MSSGDVSGRPYKTHYYEPYKCESQACRDCPFPADLVRYAACDCEAEDRGKTSDDRQDHRGGGSGVEVIDYVVAYICADRVVRHEPEKLRSEYREEHFSVFFGHRLVVVDRRCNGCKPLALFHLGLYSLGNIILFYLCKENERRYYHQYGSYYEGYLDYPELTCCIRSIYIVAELQEYSEDRRKGSAEIAHDVDYSVGLCSERLRSYIRHEGHRGVAVHHHEYQNYTHHDDHSCNVVVMEQQRNEGERDRGYECAGQNIGHALAYRRDRLIREITEYRQQYQGSQVVAGHDYSYQPLNTQYLLRVAGFELGRGDPVHASCEDIREKCRTPGVVYLPEQKYPEKGKAYLECPLVIKFEFHTEKPLFFNNL